jgi:glutamate dehydrogenase
MLYQEGMGWADRLVSIRGVREVVFGYLSEEKALAQMVAEVRAAGLAHGDLVTAILEREGRKFLTLGRLGLGLGIERN